MKKITLAFLPLIFLSLTAFAQLEKGSKILGGSFNISTQTTEYPYGYNPNKSRVRGIEISPSFGWLVSDNLVLGLQTSYFNWKNLYPTSDDQISSGFGGGTFLRKYFPAGEQFAFFGQLGINLEGKKGEYNSVIGDFNPNTRQNTFRVDTYLGCSFFPKKWMSIDLTVNPLSFSRVVEKNNGSGEFEAVTSGLNFGVNTSSIALGANFFISKK